MSAQEINLTDNPLICDCRNLIRTWFDSLPNKPLLDAHLIQNPTYTDCIAKSCTKRSISEDVKTFIKTPKISPLYQKCPA